MDDWSFRIANLLVGNPAGKSALEFTLQGPTLRFMTDAIIALTGADMKASIDAVPIPLWETIPVKKGSLLKCELAASNGYRTYLSIRGGFDLPNYLGSQATFPLGKLGGLAGTPLLAGNQLPLSDTTLQTLLPFAAKIPQSMIPKYDQHWTIKVLYGPHGSPDFLTDQDIQMFLSSTWKVHHNSNRLGIRLIGPKPKWARADGGEAGLHPSNIHDCEYAVGSINFSGDMPIILANDGPSLGGFVCPVTITRSEIWKLGQLKPNDTITFQLTDYDAAAVDKGKQDEALHAVRNRSWQAKFPIRNIRQGGILYEKAATKDSPQLMIRLAGDRNILLEYGPMELDLDSRFRVQALMSWVQKRDIEGICELSPGVRSLQVSYDDQIISLQCLLNYFIIADENIGNIDQMSFHSRCIMLPIALKDQWNSAAIEKYQQSVRHTAPYLPDNIEFIARINGLKGTQEVLDIICQAEYMVLGLGDVYLGAPCAVPLDPRHRLVTSKYNPARTFTPEGAVGIGGSYMCIYGMESPGGYQLVGRTLSIWNKHLQNPNFTDSKQWLLRFFDRVKFYPVSDEELINLRQQYDTGSLKLEIRNEIFEVGNYKKFLQENAADIKHFQATQKIAFAKEVKKWHKEGMIGSTLEDSKQSPDCNMEYLGNLRKSPSKNSIKSPSGGSIWHLNFKKGDRVKKDETIAVLEAMKMEINISALHEGVIQSYDVKVGDIVSQGQSIAVIKPDNCDQSADTQNEPGSH